MERFPSDQKVAAYLCCISPEAISTFVATEKKRKGKEGMPQVAKRGLSLTSADHIALLNSRSLTKCLEDSAEKGQERGVSSSLGSGQPVVSLSECTSKGKSSLGSHPERVSIVVFTHAEQTHLYKPDASVVEPMRWVMQLSSLPRADPPHTSPSPLGAMPGQM